MWKWYTRLFLSLWDDSWIRNKDSQEFITFCAGAENVSGHVVGQLAIDDNLKKVPQGGQRNLSYPFLYCFVI